MEWAESGLRYGESTAPNLHYTVPRAPDIAYLASLGYLKNRLPIKWEMLQPMLHDTTADAQARAAIGEPGAFNADYEAFITGILDAHAAAGIKCIVDCHNYCRYRDFRFQPNGAVTGLVKPANPHLRAYTTDSTQVWTRIFATAPGATLKPAHLADFWARAAAKWKDHPGFGGYGLMNEPYYLPKPGETVENWGGDGEDLQIWPAFAQAAIDAIRAIDPGNPIYLGGNEWSAAMSLWRLNPAWPLSGENIIYEVHMYLDASSNGQSYDYDTEVAKGYSAGFMSGPINLDTGMNRLKLAVDYAQPRGMKLALTETGMPIDDARWQEMFQRLANYARQSNVEIYTWHGGNHWPLHNCGINNVPGWHQNKTLEPVMSGVLKAAAGIDLALVFDDGPGWSPAGTPVTITVYARGYLAAPLTLHVASSNGGQLGKSVLTIPAGANGQDTFTFTSGTNRVTTLTYTSQSPGIAPPPPRRMYSLSDPVAYASTNLKDAAMAIIAKYGACKWEMADAYSDYMLGAPAQDGQAVRAVADSGYGGSVGNAMEMLNWTNKEHPALGAMALPVMRSSAGGKKYVEHPGLDTYGLWCKKTVPVPGNQPNPRNRVPYSVNDNHFALAAFSVPNIYNYGAVFQASHSMEAHSTELGVSNSQPHARWQDKNGKIVTLTAASRLPVNTPAVVAMTSVPGAQRLRVNSKVVGQASSTLVTGAFDQMLLGWGFQFYYPRPSFGGNLYAAITGKGAPTVQELGVLERYLATTCQ
jgi:endoglucanase